MHFPTPTLMQERLEDEGIEVSKPVGRTLTDTTSSGVDSQLKEQKPSEAVKPNIDDIINKIVEMVLELKPKETQPQQPREFVIIHKHYHYKPEADLEDEVEDEDEDEDEENLEDAIEEANNLIKQSQVPDLRSQIKRELSRIVFL